ncbi:hypothetical protein VP01_1000g1 [Puccinia sorghi]|uniref:Tc1-like transposase DDE domain-containing protein n=1 Tax=Puccinia sorghi TaxID=27349 RepID=A0A0L6VVB4_9BASI|nr:hypothetical protein VP01_1000g1 [Puccinia sorghi]
MMHQNQTPSISARAWEQKFCYIAKMANVPAEFLMNLQSACATCSGPFARSRCGTAATCYLHEANATRFTLVPGISYCGVLILSVAEHTFKAYDFKHFLKWKLLLRMNPYPTVNSILVMDNVVIHQHPRVKSQLQETQALFNATDPNWSLTTMWVTTVSGKGDTKM